MDYKYKLLPELSGYHSQLVWDMLEHELYREYKRSKHFPCKLFFKRCRHPYIIKELQNFFANVFGKKRIWRSVTRLVLASNYMIDYLNTQDITSILDISRETLEKGYVDFLTEKIGIKTSYNGGKYIDNKGFANYYIVKRHELSCMLQFHDFIYEHNYTNGEPLLERDIWYLNDLGFEPAGLLKYKKVKFISFKSIKQPEIKAVIKKYILSRLKKQLTISTIENNMKAFKFFLRFLEKFYPEVRTISSLTRVYIEAFFKYFAELDRAEKTKYEYTAVIRIFLNDIIKESWIEAPRHQLILRRELSFKRYIRPQIFSENELQLLKQHAYLLEDTPKRMLLVLIATGMRIGDVCSLEVSSLKQHEDGQYYLEYCQGKTYRFKKYDHGSEEMASILQILQDAISSNNGSQYIFPHSTSINDPFPMYAFIKAIKRLIYKNDLRVDGKLIIFQSHKCRRTKATRSIQKGISYRLTSYNLGHKCAFTLRHYVAPPTLSEHVAALKEVLETDDQLFRNILGKASVENVA